MKRLHKIALAAVTVEAIGAAYSFLVLPRLRRWGATAEEVARTLPGDDLVGDASYITTHAITVRAPAERRMAVARPDRAEPRRVLHL